MVSPAATAVLASLHTPVADRPRWMVVCGNLEKGNNAGPANRNRDKPVLAHRNNLRPGPRLPHGPAMRFPYPDGPSFLATNLDCVADRRLRLRWRSHLHLDDLQELKTARNPLYDLYLGVVR